MFILLTTVLTLRSSVCAYTLLRLVLIHADCKWPSPIPSTTLPLYEMITCFIQTKLLLGQDFQRDATVFKWGQCIQYCAIETCQRMPIYFLFASANFAIENLHLR